MFGSFQPPAGQGPNASCSLHGAGQCAPAALQAPSTLREVRRIRRRQIRSARKASQVRAEAPAELAESRIAEAVRIRSASPNLSAELEAARASASASLAQQGASQWVDRFGQQQRKGSDILVQALEREGINTVFAYPGGASLEIHQALTRSDTVRNILCRHEQGEIFAAEGWGKVTGEVGVCIATSGPGATNLVTGLADALLDSVPLVAITGQVPRRMIGTDAFQETPIVEVTRQITKHNYLVMDVHDIPRIMKEAFYLARTGRPGPVLVDIPKDVQQSVAVPDWNTPMAIAGYMRRLPPPPAPSQISAIVRALHEAKKPVLYVGGGCLNAWQELREFVAQTGIPVTQTLMGLGTFDATDPLSLHMLGMHGTVVANYAVDHADLLLAFGVRFDDRVTGKLEAFATRARIVHIDIDPAEINKNKEAHISMCSDMRPTLKLLNAAVAKSPVDRSCYDDWRADIVKQQEKYPQSFPTRDDVIIPQEAVKVLHEETNGEAIITTGVGQHQMWAAQWYKFRGPRQWATSGGLGSMGFGLPSALGAAAAFDGKDGRPKKIVVDIDGDGSFMMNCQELATAYIEQLDIKMMILNNQHLGMVVQWEDRFYKANRAHTYLGRREAEYHLTGLPGDIYPDFVMMAKSCGVPGSRIFRPEELRAAIRTMLDTPGPYLLDVMVPHIEHVLPMIPGGGSFKDIITTGDGSQTY